MSNDNEYWNQVIATGVLVFAMYPFTKDFLFQYPQHTIEAGAAYGLAMFISIVFVIGASIGRKKGLNKK